MPVIDVADVGSVMFRVIGKKHLSLAALVHPYKSRADASDDLSNSYAE